MYLKSDYASPVFRQMLFDPLEKGHVINLPDTTVGAFEEFLNYFYLDKITLTMEIIGEHEHWQAQYLSLSQST